MKLWLLRHASAEDRAPSGRDEDRRLTVSGRRTCHDLQAWIREYAEPLPGRILVSPAQRTLETSRTALGHLDFPPAVIEPGLWNASVGDLVKLVDQASAETSSLMLIGHNPGLEGLVRWLGGQLPIVGMKAGSLVILELPLPPAPERARTVAAFQPTDST